MDFWYSIVLKQEVFLQAKKVAGASFTKVNWRNKSLNDLLLPWLLDKQYYNPYIERRACMLNKKTAANYVQAWLDAESLVCEAQLSHPAYG
jgi:hypothetical protein